MDFTIEQAINILKAYDPTAPATVAIHDLMYKCGLCTCTSLLWWRDDVEAKMKEMGYEPNEEELDVVMVDLDAYESSSVNDEVWDMIADVVANRMGEPLAR